MANAAFSSLISQAAISMINNQGDIGAVMKDMGSDEYLKSLAISVAAAGAGEYAGQFTGSWSNSLASSTGMSQAMANSVVRVGTKTLISSTLQSSIYGANFGEALTDNLIRNSAYAVGAEAAHTIGDWNEA